jgi:hypothetical protein
MSAIAYARLAAQDGTSGSAFGGEMFKPRISVGFLVGAGSVLAALLSAQSVFAQPYTVSYTDGGTWNDVYVQGFSTSVAATPTPAASVGDTVNLSEFQFYKSGDSDSASNFQLAIFNTMYPDLTGLTTSSSSFVGLSTNTISSDVSVATGAPLSFTFNNLPLVYGDNYGAVFVNVDQFGNITPVLVSALTANYVQEPDGTYQPQSYYGGTENYDYATSNYISGGYFSAFSYAGGADFSASLSTVPEPGTLWVVASGSLLFLRYRSRTMTL